METWDWTHQEKINQFYQVWNASILEGQRVKNSAIFKLTWTSELVRASSVVQMSRSERIRCSDRWRSHFPSFCPSYVFSSYACQYPISLLPFPTKASCSACSAFRLHFALKWKFVIVRYASTFFYIFANIIIDQQSRNFSSCELMVLIRIDLRI